VKLQHGEYISLGKVEAELKSYSLIDNICMYADPTQTFAIALLTPNAEQIKVLAEKRKFYIDIMPRFSVLFSIYKIIKIICIGGINWSSFEEMCKNSQMEKFVLQEVQNYGTKSRLNKFEIPQKIKLISEVWTPDTELVTAALKLKRKNIQTRYQHLIDIMYA
jgi:long-chain acyl-CoA synthetase